MNIGGWIKLSMLVFSFMCVMFIILVMCLMFIVMVLRLGKFVVLGYMLIMLLVFVIVCVWLVEINWLCVWSDFDNVVCDSISGLVVIVVVCLMRLYVL